MYQRRLAYSSKKRKYPYSKKSYGRTKYRKANNASSYFTYDAPRAKAVSRLNAAIGSELKQKYHESNINYSLTGLDSWTYDDAGTRVYNKPFVVDPAGGSHDPPALAILPKVQQGQTYDTRIGDKITVKSIDFRIRFTLNTEHFTGPLPDAAVWIVLDKNPNGVGAKWTDIFHGSTCTTLSQKHMKNENRFQILKTFYIPMGGYPFVDADAPTVCMPPKFMYYKYKKPTIVRYQSSGGTNADIVENNIYVITTSNAGSLKNLHERDGWYTLHCSVNTRYYDS
jgi:hypothetical protein